MTNKSERTNQIKSPKRKTEVWGTAAVTVEVGFG